VGRVSLFLLDTDVPENERAEDREITASLYGGDAETRIRQELVLGIGGVRALHALGVTPSVYSMNEGHAAFLGLELLAGALETASFPDALRQTRQRVVYTNHTVVPAGNDVFSADLVLNYLGGYADENGIARDQLLSLASTGHDAGFSMAVLAFHMSGKANAVSQLHAKVIPREWPGFPVEAVTNGVHVPTWLGPAIRALLDRYVPDWQGDAPDWEAVHTIPDAELQAAHAAQRQHMIERVNGSGGPQLDPEALTLVWARRFAEYKRAFLIASDRERLVRLLGNAKCPVQIVISGKAHPRDEGGKNILRDLLQSFGQDSVLASRIAFVEDYDLDVARALTAGADVWLNTPRKPLEASGTSGMKSSDNGALQVTVTDGWAAEVDWWGVGWGIAGGDDAADSLQLYDFLENGVVPTYYDRDQEGVSHRWATMMKNTMIITLSRYSARRMLRDYVQKLYLPLVEEQQTVAEASGL
jgi:glycogen phosphorylase